MKSISVFAGVLCALSLHGLMQLIATAAGRVETVRQITAASGCQVVQYPTQRDCTPFNISGNTYYSLAWLCCPTEGRKAERLYAKLCKDNGIDAANAEVVAAAIEWHRLLLAGGRPLNAARSVVRLCEAIEKVQLIERRAGITAAQWTEIEEEPKNGG